MNNMVYFLTWCIKLNVTIFSETIGPRESAVQGQNISGNLSIFCRLGLV